MRDPAPITVHPPAVERVAVSARVSAAEHRPNLERQADRLVASCAATGEPVSAASLSSQSLQPVSRASRSGGAGGGSGITDSHPQFLTLLADPAIVVLVVEHQERATRLGFRLLAILLEQHERRIAVVHLAETERQDLVANLVAIVSSCCAALWTKTR